MGEVAQMKRNQEGLAVGGCLLYFQQLGSKAFLEGGLRLTISVSTRVYPSATGTHFMWVRRSSPNHLGFCPWRETRKRKLVEPTALAAAVKLRAATDTHSLFSTIRSRFLSLPATTHTGLGGFSDGVKLGPHPWVIWALVTVTFSGWDCCTCALRVTMGMRGYQEMIKWITCVP